MSLDASATKSVTMVVDLLAERGLALGFPYSSAIEGAAIALRELRVQSGGKPIRIFYAFDPERQAILLIGGDKSNDKRFYARMIPRAEAIWRSYLVDVERSKKGGRGR